MSQYTQVGRLKKAFGDDGRLRITLFEDYLEFSSNQKIFFVLLDGFYVPFFVKSFNQDKGTIKFDYILNQAEADEIGDNPLFLPKIQLERTKTTHSEPKHLIYKGYELYDQNEKYVGIIEDVLSYPMQELLLLRQNVLIPINMGLIIKSNNEIKRLFLEIPEGLI